MRSSASPLPRSGFALEVDGHLKTSFDTLEGAMGGAKEIIRRFPKLRVRIYDLAAQTSLEVAGP
ncbi:6-aminohexanoate-cyclic-dimer hydrolase [Bradyrhizobium vignae]|uniref:6-aminohexanoate-cyclic-dimer hydrolase n=1 Tax=Bradyrhizobium vignae TaxID=1549949 RepID=A0A2U3PV37_9BRAD|nr:6-aminohexanoate-cyclic-dimer hydrolase [Bradyrhizobium vignae]